jgi:hypothetical protein
MLPNVLGLGKVPPCRNVQVTENVIGKLAYNTCYK